MLTQKKTIFLINLNTVLLGFLVTRGTEISYLISAVQIQTL